MKNKRILVGVVALIAAIVLLITGISINLNKKTTTVNISTSELARAMTYEQFEEGDEAVESTDNVKFSAFFLRDLDGDGYAEKIKGTCRPIGAEDTLYMEINVQTEGYLKDAKVEILGQNFYMQATLPKDEQIKDNYIGNNVKRIEFNQLNNGTQKLISGTVRSGDYSNASKKAEAIGKNLNNLSRTDNKIKLTGTYVGEDGREIEINKEIDLAMDWYGTTNATITGANQTYRDLPNRIDEEKGTIKLGFKVTTNETKQELNISKNHVTGTIPELNGYTPIEVKMTNGTTNTLTFDYDSNTRTFKIERAGVVSEEGIVTTSVARNNTYELEVTYPIEAYQAIGEDTVSLKIPVQTYYEGYNNPNPEFTNPYRSTVSSNIVVNYSNPVEAGPKATSFTVTVGKNVYKPTSRYIVSKQKPLKIYNGTSEKETEDIYTVRWYAYIGTEEQATGITLRETKTGEAQASDSFIKTDSTEVRMEEITSNIGIYFTGAGNLLKEDGWIKVYDEETGNLLETFTKYNWNKYTATNPYKYELPVKHIRIETSETNIEQGMYVYHIKELNDAYITENIEKAEFDELKYIKTTLNGYVNGEYRQTKTAQANYEAPYSVATIGLSKNTISTQVTEENAKITITTTKDKTNNQLGWVDGSFLVKLPEEILAVEINEVTINSREVDIITYEVIEKAEEKFIKINTENKYYEPQGYTITIDADITPDPRLASSTKNIELYASNKETGEYYYKGQDIYDVNDNLNTEETINKTQVGIKLVSPSSLLTNQTVSEYDSKNNVVIAPQIAEITPRYAKVDNEKQTAKIGIQIKNNYALTISEVVILGKIPFEGNTTVVSNQNLGSEFTTKMIETGIEIPEELAGKITVYYSENETPDKDLTKEENGWKTKENITNWENIKTFLIDFEEEVLAQGVEYTFYYKVEIPEGTEFNKTTYSHHGIYFSLDTAEGKYRTQTEPNKLGLRIVEKFNLEIIKTQTGKDKKVAGATYAITEILEDGTVGITKTGVTDQEGKIIINNLYAERTYEIQEIKIPNDYELNEEVIRFTSHVLEDGTLTIEKTQGSTKEEITVTKNEGEKHRVKVKVEDEAKAKLRIIKKEQGTENRVSYVKYKLTGYGMPSNGRILTTNTNGEISISGLKIGEEYTLEETKASGYYLADPITFKIVNNEGTYEIQIIKGTVLENSVTEEESLPIANLSIENEKIPTYTLEISKIKKVLETELTEEETEEGRTEEKEITYLPGAKFKLYKDGKEIGEYTTDVNGKIVIENLYQYIEGKDEDATYTLKEVIAPVGYAKVKDITFKVQNADGTLQLINQEGKEEKYTVEGTTVKLTIEDSPSFRLIKKDAETGEVIANVKFAIYKVEKKGDEGVPAINGKGEKLGTLETINGKEYYTVKTDENGTLTIDLPEGYYKAVEVEAPEKYDIKDSTYYFGIGGSGEIKYEPHVEWAKAIGGINSDSINSVSETSDGGYIAGGYFADASIAVGNIINLGNGINITSNGSEDGILIKYNEEGSVEWAKNIGGSDEDYINSVEGTLDGGYIVGGYFYSSTIDLENDVTLTNRNGYSNGMIIKYSAEGVAEWAKVIGGSKNDKISSIVATSDGGCIVVGDFSSTIDLGNGVRLTTNSVGNKICSDGMIIKYSAEGNVDWAIAVGGSDDDYINSVEETLDGGFIVGGYFESSTINLEKGAQFIRQGNCDGMIIKYSEEGNIDWAKKIGGSSSDYITSVEETLDGDYIVGGYFDSSTINFGNEVTLINNGGTDGMVIKYSQNGVAQWAEGTGASGYEYINSVTETSDGDYIVGGEFHSSTIDLGNGVILENSRDKTYTDGMLIKYNEEGEVDWARAIGGAVSENIYSVSETRDGGFIAGGKGGSMSLKNGLTVSTHGSIDGIIVRYGKVATKAEIPETQELIVENERKEFKITTDVYEIDGIKGGTISGEDEEIYEVVKYGDNTIKEIVMVPNEGYEIIKTTVNGEEFKFTENEDGSYTMPMFTNITENKHIEVTYSLKDNKLIINKLDSETKVGLERATFKLDQIEEREVPESTIGTLTENGQEYIELDLEKAVTDALGSLTDNGQEYYGADLSKEVTDVLGSLTNNGTYYFVEKDGKYVPTNSKTYQVANGGTAGKASTTANAYIEIDLTNKTGEYAVAVNANISSESNYDYGYATIKTTATAPSYSSSTGQFIKISGTVAAKDYTSGVLEGGNKYYLHLGYRKDSSGDTGTDQIIFNSIKVYEVIGRRYNFVENNGKYESNNIGQHSTVANSYIPIDLTNKEGKYALIVNANVSSASGDYGYATVTENTTRPAYNSSTGRFIYITGTVETKDYQATLLEGGKVYYLHLGYYKNTSGDSGYDKFTVNSVNLYETKTVTYNFIENNGKYESTETIFGKDSRKVNSYIPIDLRDCKGTYNLIVNANISSASGDYGYVTITENTTRPAYNSSTGRLIYITGNVDSTDYATVLEGEKLYYLHLGYYKNASGSSGEDKFTVNSITITPNADDLYHTEITTNSEGKGITQIPFGKYSVTETVAPNGYELNENSVVIEFRADGNHEFTFENSKLAKVIVHHYIKGTTTKVAEDDILQDKAGYPYTTLPKLDLEKYELEKREDGSYVMPENATGQFISGEQEVIYYYVKKEGEVIVHHYIEGTQDKVTLVDESLAESVILKGEIGTEYETKELTEELAEKYELSIVPENKEGIYDEEVTEVIYYYRIKTFNIVTKVQNYKETTELGQEVEVIGGTIVGDEIVAYGETSTKDIIIIPEQGYEVRKITINGEEQDFTENEYGIVTLSKFENIIENKEIVVTFGKIRGIVIVHHYLEGTEEELISSEVKKGAIGLSYATKPHDDLVINYNVVNSPENRSGFYEEETIEVKYYYSLKKDVEYKVEWYYQEEGKYPETPNKSETRIADALEEVKVTEEDLVQAEEYASYVHDTEIEVLKGTVLGDGSLVLKIYFKPQFKVTYKPGEQGLFEEETYENIDYGSKLPKFEGEIGDNGNPKGKEGYVFRGWVTEEGEVAEEIVTKDVVYVAQWKKAEVEYTVEYYYDGVKDETKTDILKGEYEEVIENYKDKAKENHTLIKTKGLPLTITNKAEANIIRIYYGTKAEASVQYITKTTNEETGEEVEEILEESTEEGYVGKEYITIAKDFDNYILVEQPEEKIVLMIEEEQVLKYYYKKVESGVIEKHIESHKEEIIDSKVHEGEIGEEYKTEEQEFIGFRLLRNRYPENSEGIIEEEVITVKYYYSKDAKVTVKYIDIATNEEIEESVIIEGQLGDEYETEEKEVEGYRIVRLEYPDNAKGEITKEETEVIYYYERIPSGTITVKYVDIETEEEIADKVEIKGFIGEEYKTEEKEILYYMVVNSTENTEGKLTEENNTVIYYYRKLSFNFRVDKTITQINLRDREIKFDKPTKMAKVEIKQGELKEEELVITYNLEITNTGEMSGKARIKEVIPPGFELLEGIEESTIIELQPGESKNMTVKLRWLKGEQNLGIKENLVELVDIINAKGYRELTTEDNNSTATVVVTIKTGETIKNIAKGLLILSLAICLYMEILLVISIKKGPDIKEIKFLKKK